MERLLPSELARLVLGYFQEEDFEDLAEEFLETSKHLGECLELVREGEEVSTRPYGKNLKDMLKEYCALQKLILQKVRRLGPQNLRTRFLKLDPVEQLQQLLLLRNDSSVSSADLQSTQSTTVVRNQYSSIIATFPSVQSTDYTTQKSENEREKKLLGVKDESIVANKRSELLQGENINLQNKSECEKEKKGFHHESSDKVTIKESPHNVPHVSTCNDTHEKPDVAGNTLQYSLMKNGTSTPKKQNTINDSFKSKWTVSPIKSGLTRHLRKTFEHNAILDPLDVKVFSQKIFERIDIAVKDKKIPPLCPQNTNAVIDFLHSYVGNEPDVDPLFEDFVDSVLDTSAHVSPSKTIIVPQKTEKHVERERKYIENITGEVNVTLDGIEKADIILVNDDMSEVGVIPADSSQLSKQCADTTPLLLIPSSQSQPMEQLSSVSNNSVLQSNNVFIPTAQLGTLTREDGSEPTLVMYDSVQRSIVPIATPIPVFDIQCCSPKTAAINNIMKSYVPIVPKISSPKIRSLENMVAQTSSNVFQDDLLSVETCVKNEISLTAVQSNIHMSGPPEIFCPVTDNTGFQDDLLSVETCVKNEISLTAVQSNIYMSGPPEIFCPVTDNTGSSVSDNFIDIHQSASDVQNIEFNDDINDDNFKKIVRYEECMLTPATTVLYNYSTTENIDNNTSSNKKQRNLKRKTKYKGVSLLGSSNKICKTGSHKSGVSKPKYGQANETKSHNDPGLGKKSQKSGVKTNSTALSNEALESVHASCPVLSETVKVSSVDEFTLPCTSKDNSLQSDNIVSSENYVSNKCASYFLLPEIDKVDKIAAVSCISEEISSRSEIEKAVNQKSVLSENYIKSNNTVSDEGKGATSKAKDNTIIKDSFSKLSLGNCSKSTATEKQCNVSNNSESLKVPSKISNIETKKVEKCSSQFLAEFNLNTKIEILNSDSSTCLTVMDSLESNTSNSTKVKRKHSITATKTSDERLSKKPKSIEFAENKVTHKEMSLRNSKSQTLVDSRSLKKIKADKPVSLVENISDKQIWKSSLKDKKLFQSEPIVIIDKLKQKYIETMCNSIKSVSDRNMSLVLSRNSVQQMENYLDKNILSNNEIQLNSCIKSRKIDDSSKNVLRKSWKTEKTSSDSIQGNKRVEPTSDTNQTSMQVENNADKDSSSSKSVKLKYIEATSIDNIKLPKDILTTSLNFKETPDESKELKTDSDTNLFLIPMKNIADEASSSAKCSKEKDIKAAKGSTENIKMRKEILTKSLCSEEISKNNPEYYSTLNLSLNINSTVLQKEMEYNANEASSSCKSDLKNVEGTSTENIKLPKEHLTVLLNVKETPDDSSKELKPASDANLALMQVENNTHETLPSCNSDSLNNIGATRESTENVKLLELLTESRNTKETPNNSKEGDNSAETFSDTSLNLMQVENYADNTSSSSKSYVMKTIEATSAKNIESYKEALIELFNTKESPNDSKESDSIVESASDTDLNLMQVEKNADEASSSIKSNKLKNIKATKASTENIKLPTEAFTKLRDTKETSNDSSEVDNNVMVASDTDLNLTLEENNSDDASLSSKSDKLKTIEVTNTENIKLCKEVLIESCNTKESPNDSKENDCCVEAPVDANLMFTKVGQNFDQVLSSSKSGKLKNIEATKASTENIKLPKKSWNSNETANDNIKGNNSVKGASSTTLNLIQVENNADNASSSSKSDMLKTIEAASAENIEPCKVVLTESCNTKESPDDSKESNSNVEALSDANLSLMKVKKNADEALSSSKIDKLKNFKATKASIENMELSKEAFIESQSTYESPNGSSEIDNSVMIGSDTNLALTQVKNNADEASSSSKSNKLENIEDLKVSAENIKLPKEVLTKSLCIEETYNNNNLEDDKTVNFVSSIKSTLMQEGESNSVEAVFSNRSGKVKNIEAKEAYNGNIMQSESVLSQSLYTIEMSNNRAGDYITISPSPSINSPITQEENHADKNSSSNKSDKRKAVEAACTENITLETTKSVNLRFTNKSQFVVKNNMFESVENSAASELEANLQQDLTEACNYSNINMCNDPCVLESNVVGSEVNHQSISKTISHYCTSSKIVEILYNENYMNEVYTENSLIDSKGSKDSNKKDKISANLTENKHKAIFQQVIFESNSSRLETRNFSGHDKNRLLEEDIVFQGCTCSAISPIEELNLCFVDQQTLSTVQQQASSCKHQILSPVKQQAPSPNEQQSTSPDEQHSSPVEQLTTSPVEQLTTSSDEQHSSYSVEQLTTSPDEQHSSSVEQLTTSPDKQHSSPVEQLTTSPDEQHSSSVEQLTTFPIKQAFGVNKRPPLLLNNEIHFHMNKPLCQLNHKNCLCLKNKHLQLNNRLPLLLNNRSHLQ